MYAALSMLRNDFLSVSEDVRPSMPTFLHYVSGSIRSFELCLNWHNKHQKQVDELIKHDHCITQKQIAGRLRMSKERVGYIIGLLGYTKVCSRWAPRMLTLKFEVLSHPPYSPDLAPSDFHFFPHLKRALKGTHFTSDDEVKQAVMSWIKERKN